MPVVSNPVLVPVMIRSVERFSRAAALGSREASQRGDSSGKKDPRKRRSPSYIAGKRTRSDYYPIEEDVDVSADSLEKEVYYRLQIDEAAWEMATEHGVAQPRDNSDPYAVRAASPPLRSTPPAVCKPGVNAKTGFQMKINLLSFTETVIRAAEFLEAMWARKNDLEPRHVLIGAVRVEDSGGIKARIKDGLWNLECP
ncbi:hypothetical protein B0H10DRAFT_1945281 [Mycena sp. CBHHK59/15]|nr:hypothetical protein B0H10DRAFT_1945281 [Mycena sp. CBHHK59/15]